MKQIIATCIAAACAGPGCDGYWTCEVADLERIGALPSALSETGLYADLATETLAGGVVAYRPQFQLWSDGAEKRRWIWLPPGTQIDTTDLDSWVFPAGTKLWKEFSRDGIRVETRLFEKRGATDEDWVAVAYAWTTDQHDAPAAPLGVIDALGTSHDVPAAGECFACHGARRSRILGFSAIQLSYDAPAGELDLDDLVAAGLLTSPPARSLVVPGTETERAALGYLHANCSHCHNSERPASAPCFDPPSEIDFLLATDELATIDGTATYRTAIDRCVEPGDAAGSRMIDLVSHRGFGAQMPPLATEKVDPNAVALLRTWIDAMEKTR